MDIKTAFSFRPYIEIFFSAQSVNSRVAHELPMQAEGSAAGS
jgi:hypothetical protein